MHVMSGTSEENNEIFDRYVSATTAFHTGLTAGAEFLLQDLVLKCEVYLKNTGERHDLHTSILDLLAKISLNNKDYEGGIRYIKLILDIDPDSIRAYYRLFQLQLDVFADEKEALKIHMNACEVIERRGRSHPDYTLFKAMKHRGDKIKLKRSTFFILEETAIVADNLFKVLPIEVVSNIMKLLENEDKINMLHVCKGWRASILSSPQLISLYTIPGYLTTNKLLSFLRLFDQLSPLTEIILEELRIHLSTEARLLRLLLSSQIKCKKLFVNISGTSKLLGKVLVDEGRFGFLANVQYLSLEVETSGCLEFVAGILRLCTNLRQLSIVLSYTSTNVEKVQFDQPILLPYVQEIYWESSDRCLDTAWFIEKLEFKNVISAKVVKNGTILLRKLKRLTSIELIGSEFVSNANMLFGKDEIDMSRVESIAFVNCHRANRNELIVKENSIPRLKSLRISLTRIRDKDFMDIYNKCRGTLESIELSGELGFNSGSTNFDSLIEPAKLDLKLILENSPKLRRVVLDSNMKPSIFVDSVIDIARCDRLIHLDYFRVNSSLLQTRDLILFVVMIKGKLIIDEIAFPIRNKIELSDFLQEAINEGRIKKCTWVSI